MNSVWSTSGQTLTDHGQAWANMVKNANSWATSAGYQTWVSFSAGEDFEPGMSGPGHARTWLNGFIAAGTSYNVFDFAGNAGCPAQTGNNACSNGWHTDDVWYMAWGSSDSNPLPEIYQQLNATVWYYIDVYATNHGNNTAMNFVGSTSECAAVTPPCTQNTPDQAWSQLYDAVNPTPGDTNIQWSINFTWDT